MALIRDAGDTPLTVHPIRLLPDPVLRRKAVRVPAIDASTHRLIEDMIESMYAANGVGLAAPQIGVSLRVVVIGLPEEEPFALINPEVVKRSGERTVDEGCLSLPGYRGELTRSTLVIVKGLDPSGKQVRIKARDNLLAQALEHETDHINGTLYVDYLPSMDVLRRIDQGGDEDDEEAEGEESFSEGETAARSD
jgi:peptide deformylase